MKEITVETKIVDLIKENENMKNILIDINSNFKKLNKPIISETLAYEGANLKEAAIVVGMKPNNLVNILRKKFNQELIIINDDDTQQEAPQWILNKIIKTINANDILKRELSPLTESNKILEEISNGELFTMVSNFQPQPLVDDLIKDGHSVYTEKVNNKEFVIYVKKQS